MDSSSHPLLHWILEALGRSPSSWSAEQTAFIHALLEREEGTRVLSSLVVTTLRLRKSSLPPEKDGPLSSVLPSIEAFWNDPSPQTFQELRIARWLPPSPPAETS